jgi:vacuolar-type H+-ATPase subunit I/STV1
MKMSILLGVVHMNLGIMMSLFNNLYFKDRLSTLCEFVPQVRLVAGVLGLGKLQSGFYTARWASLYAASADAHAVS